MPCLLPDDSDDRPSRRLYDLEENVLLQDGWINFYLGSTLYGGGIPNKPEYLCVLAIY